MTDKRRKFDKNDYPVLYVVVYNNFVKITIKLIITHLKSVIPFIEILELMYSNSKAGGPLRI